MSLSYYNEVINPDGLPILGINNSIEKPPPLPDPETQNQTEPEPESENQQIVIFEIRPMYKLSMTSMFILTFCYILFFPDGYINILDMIMSCISHYYVFKNDVKFLQIHTVYLMLRFILAVHFRFIEYLGYYFIYAFINTCAILTLVSDQNNYFRAQVQQSLNNVV